MKEAEQVMNGLRVKGREEGRGRVEQGKDNKG